MASKVIIASLLLACFACASATEAESSKDGHQGLSVTVIGAKSPETLALEAAQNKVDHITAWTNFGKGCKCEEKCVDRVKEVCKATMVPEEDCKEVEVEVPIVKCKTECKTPADGTTVLITLPSHHGRKLFTEKKNGKDAKLCKEVCEDSTKKNKEKKCETKDVEKLDCKEVKDGKECEKVCTCNGIVTRTKKVPLFSVTKGL